MKYRLTKEAIEELKAMEFSTPRSMFVMEGMGDMRRILSGEWIFEEIKPKLPKPVLRSLKDFKALEGWEYRWDSFVRWWMPRNTPCNYLGELYTAKIRQIDMPENEYLVADCIEQEIEAGDLVQWIPFDSTDESQDDLRQYSIVESIIGGLLFEVDGDQDYVSEYMLIRKASEITAEDREKYLGEKQEAKEPISLADYQAHKDREFEAKVREIIKKVLKEEAGE